MSDALLSWALLNVLTKKRCDILLQRYGSLEEICCTSGLLKTLGCTTDVIERIKKKHQSLDIAKERAYLKKEHIYVLHINDAAYPPLLKTLPDPPVFLFAKGNLTLLTKPAIALVGSRAMTSYGKRVTALLVPDLVQAGLVTVSGLALGIDGEVARETLRAQGETIAVLGHGFSHLYPSAHQELAQDIAKCGLLLTEYPPDVPPGKYTFPARNRIIAGLTLGTVIIEAAAKSGSLITAHLALDYGREVFAVPGGIFDVSEGTHSLLLEGAKPVRSAKDILEDLPVLTQKTSQEVVY